jgi:hypothetical protein
MLLLESLSAVELNLVSYSGLKYMITPGDLLLLKQSFFRRPRKSQIFLMAHDIFRFHNAILGYLETMNDCCFVRTVVG